MFSVRPRATTVWARAPYRSSASRHEVSVTVIWVRPVRVRGSSRAGPRPVARLEGWGCFIAGVNLTLMSSCGVVAARYGGAGRIMG